MERSDYKKLRLQLNFDFNYGHFWLQVGLDLSTLLLIGYIFTTSWALVNILLIPLLMFRQFSVLHEAVHGLAHPQSTLNSFLGIVSGALCLTPFVIWKDAHLKHHYWTGNLEKDPTFAIIKRFNKSSDREKKFLQWAWNLGIPVLGGLQHWGFFLQFTKTFAENKKSKEYWGNLFIPLFMAGAVLTLLNWKQLLILTAASYLYFRLFEDLIIPHHFGLYSNDDAEMRLPVWEQHKITRSWKLPYALEKFVVLNMNYHAEHHLFPDLPWHQLQRAHNLLGDVPGGHHNIVTEDWMVEQRQRPFADVIRPVAMVSNHKKAI